MATGTTVVVVVVGVRILSTQFSLKLLVPGYALTLTRPSWQAYLVLGVLGPKLPLSNRYNKRDYFLRDNIFKTFLSDEGMLASFY